MAFQDISNTNPITPRTPIALTPSRTPVKNLNSTFTVTTSAFSPARAKKQWGTIKKAVL